MQFFKRKPGKSELKASTVTIPDVTEFLKKTEVKQEAIWLSGVPFPLYAQKRHGMICICGEDGCGIGPFREKMNGR